MFDIQLFPFSLPSTPNHMNTQGKKALARKLRYIWPYLGMPCSQFAESLPFFRIPRLIGEGMQRKICGAQGTDRKGTSYSSFLGLQHAEKSKAQYRWQVTDSSESWSRQEGFKASYLGSFTVVVPILIHGYSCTSITRSVAKSFNHWQKSA